LGGVDSDSGADGGAKFIATWAACGDGSRLKCSALGRIAIGDKHAIAGNILSAHRRETGEKKKAQRKTNCTDINK